MKMESLYQEIILDHYKHPHGRGLKDPYSGEAHHVNPTCGDELTVRVRLSADGSVVEELSYEGQGCSISQASASVLHDLVAGQPVPDAMAVGDEFQRMIGGRGTVEPDEEVLGDGIAFAGVAKYPARVKCALLGWMAFKDATARGLTDASAAADASTSTEATR
jgi:nitrogen fixation NifU-like protein